MWETRAQSLGWEDPLEKEMTTHSTILAWRIPWTEEPGRLQSTGSQRVGHNWVTSLFTFYLPTEPPGKPRFSLSIFSSVFLPPVSFSSFLSLPWNSSLFRQSYNFIYCLYADDFQICLQQIPPEFQTQWISPHPYHEYFKFTNSESEFVVPLKFAPPLIIAKGTIIWVAHFRSLEFILSTPTLHFQISYLPNGSQFCHPLSFSTVTILI